MRHYVDTTGGEFASYLERAWKGMKRIQRRARSACKHSYRRRERLALKAALAAEVEDELMGSDLAYWERELDDAYDDYIAASEHLEWLVYVELWEDVEEASRALKLASERFDRAYHEWLTAA